MTKDSLSEVIRALVSDTANRSQAARLRDVLPEIEAAVKAGVKHEAILKALRDQGFTMTKRSYQGTLSRLRKKREKEGDATPRHSPITALPPTDHQQTEQPAAPSADDENKTSNRRERADNLANQYIDPESSNSLLNRIKNKGKKV